MEKVKVSFENILAGLLLRFGKANVTDIKIIQDDLFSRYGILMSPFALDYHGISRVIMKVGDNYYPIDCDDTKEVFSHGRELEQIGLKIPQITRIMQELKEKGFNLPDGILTVNEALSCVLKLLKKEGKVW